MASWTDLLVHKRAITKENVFKGMFYSLNIGGPIDGQEITFRGWLGGFENHHRQETCTFQTLYFQYTRILDSS